MKSSVLFFFLWLVVNLLLPHLPLPRGGGEIVFALITSAVLAGLLIFAVSLSLQFASRLIEWKKQSLVRLGIFLFATFCMLYLAEKQFAIPERFFVDCWTALLFLGATYLGTLLSVAIKRIGELIPVALTAAAADFASVLLGPTKDMAAQLTTYYQTGMEGPPPLVTFFLIKAGMPGYAIPLPLFGVSDWVFLILLSASLIRLGYSDNLLGEGGARKGIYLPVTVLGLFCCLLVAQILHLFLPAMVFITLFFLIYLGMTWHLNRWNQITRKDLLYSCLFPVAAFCCIVLLGSRA